MQIYSWNVNGIRACYKHGFNNWFKKTKPDILCLQETKAREEQFPPELLKPTGYNSYFNTATKKGYSSQVIYSKQKPISVNNKLGFKQFDSEARFLELKFKNFTVINLYMPHGQRDKGKLPYKLKCYDYVLKYLGKNKNRNIIAVGDFNIAREEIDLNNPKGNQNGIMFSPKERETINKIIELNYIDSFRQLHPNSREYTWWPYFYNARERNLGWRIDYCFTSKSLNSKIKKAFILNKVKGSDHCPIGIEI